MVKTLIEADNLEVEELKKPEEMNTDNTQFKEMYVYDPKNKTIKTVVQTKQTRKHFNQDKMKEHMEKMRLARQSKIKAKKQPQPQPQPQPTQQRYRSAYGACPQPLSCHSPGVCLYCPQDRANAQKCYKSPPNGSTWGQYISIRDVCDVQC
jgi:hypothetical protein